MFIVQDRYCVFHLLFMRSPNDWSISQQQQQLFLVVLWFSFVHQAMHYKKDLKYKLLTVRKRIIEH